MKSASLQIFFLVLLVAARNPANAQVMRACNDPEGGIQIWFDYNQNCPGSPGSLAGLAQIGFHSGANGWASIVAWDAANAATGVNIGNDTFVLDMPDPNAYYGTTVTALNFVFNQGATNPAEPWGSEGKEDNGAGGCNDFYLDFASITETCPESTGTQDILLDKSLTIMPNPVTDRAVVSFENEAGENYHIRITNAMGQLVKELRLFNGDQFVFQKEGQSAGVYFVTLTNEKGQFFSGEMMVR